MSKIIKTTSGEASFVMIEKFEDETKAQEGSEPVSSEVKIEEVKIENTKWKKYNGKCNFNV